MAIKLDINMREWDGDCGQTAWFVFFLQEKWDSMTRKWRDNCLLQLVRLFLIDEVRHLTQTYTYIALHSAFMILHVTPKVDPVCNYEWRVAR